MAGLQKRLPHDARYNTMSPSKVSRSRKDTPLEKVGRAFFDRSVHEVAPELIGAMLVNGVGGRIVEVEAYHHTDPAAHSYRGLTRATP